MRNPKSVSNIWVPLVTLVVLAILLMPWLLIVALPALVPLAVVAMWRVRHHFPDGHHHPGDGHHRHT